MGAPDNLNQAPNCSVIHQPRDKLVGGAPVAYHEDILVVKGVIMIPIRAVENPAGEPLDSVDIFGAFRDVAETCSSDEEPAVPVVHSAVFAVDKVNLPEAFILEPPRGDAYLAHVDVVGTAVCGPYVMDVGQNLALRAVGGRPIEIESEGEGVDLDYF